jgi:hypothetical protein
MPIFKGKSNNKCWDECRETGSLLLMGMQISTTIMVSRMEIPQKAKR